MNETTFDFILARHCQSLCNQQRIGAGGGLDLSLSDEGVTQSINMAADIKGQRLGIGSIVSSGMLRATQTADTISQALGLPVRADKGFNEQDLGDWSLMDWATISAHMKSGETPPNGESRAMFYERAQAALLTARYDRPLALIVAHGGIFYALADMCRLELKAHPGNGDTYHISLSQGANGYHLRNFRLLYTCNAANNQLVL